MPSFPTVSSAALFTPIPVPIDPIPIVNDLINESNQLFAYIVAKYNAMYNRVWKSADPAAVVAAMGTQAARIFQESYMLAMYINGRAANTVTVTVPAGWIMTYHEDGSATAVKS